MRKTIFYFSAISVLLCSCLSFKRVRKLIDQKEKYIWTNTIESKNYVLHIDSNQGKRFFGKITIDNADTFFLYGFEKGSHHVTYVKKIHYDTISKPVSGNISIWTRGYKADTVQIKNNRDSIQQLPIYFTLNKVKKIKPTAPNKSTKGIK